MDDIFETLGRTGRSVSLADEEHRKMVKEIIRNARDPVKNRILPQTVIDKYVKKITALNDRVKQVIEEEQAEREIAALENKANRLENQLKTGADASQPERVWFKPEKDKKKLTKRKAKKAMAFEDEEDKQNYREAEFISRQAKRARKPKKMQTFNDAAGGKAGKAKKKGPKSAFEDQIANVKRTNVKKMRHQGNVKHGKKRAGGGKKPRH